MKANSPIWIRPTERDCNNCGFGILHGEDDLCIHQFGVVKANLPAIDPVDDELWCLCWHPHCRATDAHRKAWYRSDECEAVNNQHWESLVGPLDKLHL